MFVGLATFMPHSPRQLIRNGKLEEARIQFVKIRRDLQSEEVNKEFSLMRAQIEYEMQREITSYREVFKLFRHRSFVSIAVQTMTALTGVNVKQYYQTILFKSLGINSHMILALAAIYGTIAFTSNCITTKFVTDQWGRRPMILTGLAGIILIEIYAAVMQLEFQKTDNKDGKGSPRNIPLCGLLVRYAQFNNLAIWCRSPAHRATKQDHGFSGSITFHRQCCDY